VAGYDAVFGAGNAVTGKGNIVASRKHSVQIGTHLIEQFLGLGDDGHTGEEAALNAITVPVDESVQKIADWVRTRPPLDAAQVDTILRRARARQNAVGHTGTYRDWIARFTPTDMT